MEKEGQDKPSFPERYDAEETDKVIHTQRCTYMNLFTSSNVRKSGPLGAYALSCRCISAGALRVVRAGGVTTLP